MRIRYALAAVAAAGALTVTGCSADRPDSAGKAAADNGGRAAGAYAESKADVARPTEPAPGSGAKRPAPLAREHIIRTARIEVEVRSAVRGAAEARRIAETLGGHVASESTERVHGESYSATITLRVPQERFGEALKRLEQGGKLLDRDNDSKDVTGQVIDTESRIATQRASVNRVRKLMDSAERISDIVMLEGELTRRQAELESLLAQQASLKDRTSLSTITLELSEPVRNDDDGDEGAPGVLDALEGGWDALGSTARWVGVVFAATLPFLVVLAGLWALWRWLLGPAVRRVRPARPDTAGSHPAPLPAYGSVLPPAAPAGAGDDGDGDDGDGDDGDGDDGGNGDGDDGGNGDGDDGGNGGNGGNGGDNDDDGGHRAGK
jgi:hypothetical protein